MPIFLRFAKGYCWATIKDDTAIADNKLPDPVKLLEAPAGSVAPRHDTCTLARSARTAILGGVIAPRAVSGMRSVRPTALTTSRVHHLTSLP